MTRSGTNSRAGTENWRQIGNQLETTYGHLLQLSRTMLRTFISNSVIRSLSIPGLQGGVVGTQRFSTAMDPTMDDYEKKVYNMLKESFQPKNLEVKDVSGGCGSMFAILVESEQFKGIPMIKQHRLVNEVLKDEIKQWHGLQLKTKS